jgi:hypothetical protein
MKSNSAKMLEEFFATYFHEDFLVDELSADAVIKRYVGSMPKHHRLELSKAIQQYAAAFDSDIDLENSLYQELGCYYRPSSEGISARSWLQKIAHELIST